MGHEIGTRSRTRFRAFAWALVPLLVAAATARCAGAGAGASASSSSSSSASGGGSAGTPVSPAFRCGSGASVSCWNATRQFRGTRPNGETVCEWSCADYEGRRAALTLHLWPTCAGVYSIDRECPWICYVEADEERPACPGP